MATDTWLTPDEIIELTAKKRWSVQCRTLAQMGIPFRPNAVGRPLVERAVVLRVPARPQTERAEPNWAALTELAARGQRRRNGPTK